jgi:addiction module RelE/StbE family toxin
MAYKVVISKSAKADLGSILDYIINQLENPKASKDFFNKVEKSITQISENPKMYALMDDAKFSMMGYRKVVIGNYLLIYKFDEKNEIVSILRFFFGYRDYTRFM